MLVSKRQKWNHTPIFRRKNNLPEEVYGFEDHHSVLLKVYRILSSYYKFELKEPLGDLVVVHTQNLMDR